LTIVVEVYNGTGKNRLNLQNINFGVMKATEWATNPIREASFVGKYFADASGQLNFIKRRRRLSRSNQNWGLGFSLLTTPTSR
jgi:hypothetical protein